jgi:hypothetical protein
MSKARHGRAYWTGVVTEFERSGQSHERFCERRKLNVGTFRAWLYRLRAEGMTEVPRFVELSADAPTAPMGCLVRVGFATIEFDSAPEPAYLAAFISAISTAS